MDFSQAELGPKMQACTPLERRFVWAYLKNGGKDATAAAREAGYSDPGPHSSGIRVRAHEALHRERVIAAIDEVARKSFRGLLLPAVAAMENLIDSPKHPAHAKTVFSTLSRLGLAERSGVDVNVSGSVDVNHTDEAVAHLRLLKSLDVPRDKLVEIFGFSGLPRYERMLAEVERRAIAGPVIEGEVVRDGG
jgi:hypothetical protein